MDLGLRPDSGGLGDPRRPHASRPLASYDTLVAARRVRPLRPGGCERIEGLGSYDVYNPCHFVQDGKEMLAARVESRTSDWHDPLKWNPRVVFFERTSPQAPWKISRSAPEIPLHEDPYVSWIVDAQGQRQLLVGCVTLDRSKANPTSPGLDPALSDPIPVTEFFMAPRLEDIDPGNPVARVYGMKDGFRVLSGPNGSLIVSTRPTDGRIGENVLGLMVVDDIAHLDAASVVAQSTLLNTGLDANTFIALNEMCWVKDRRGATKIAAIGCISHDTPDKGWQFAPVAWIMDPVAGTMTVPEVIAVRSDFPPASPKEPYLADVLFPGSLVPSGIGRATLWTGVSDNAVGSLVLPDPFARMGYTRLPAA